MRTIRARRNKLTKQFYAIPTQNFKAKMYQSDKLENLQKRLKKLFTDEPEHEAMAIYDRYQIPQKRSRIGTFDKNGFTKYYH